MKCPADYGIAAAPEEGYAEEAGSGGKINGEQLKKAEDISKIIFNICNEVIRKKNPAKDTKNIISQKKSHENAKGV